MADETRSPLKDKPLRLPGQSLEREREEYIEKQVQDPLLFALFLAVLAGMEWWRFYMDMKPNPVIFTLAAGVAAVYAGVRIWRAIPRLRALRRGLDGERAVGQYLERLREQGFQVFHDVVGDGFNVDHVLIGPAGVFTIETKTWSKPLRGPAEITFDGESISSPYGTPTRDPVVQARAQANWLRSVLADTTGRRFDVRPVIAFPGWFVVNGPGTFRDVWVLEPKALPGFLEKEPSRLEREDVKLASYHLSRMIRASQKSEP